MDSEQDNRPNVTRLIELVEALADRWQMYLDTLANGETWDFDEYCGYYQYDVSQWVYRTGYELQDYVRTLTDSKVD